MSFSKSLKSSAASSSALQNVKPYLNGQSLVSSGNRDLDEILGGGHLLGTTTMITLDSLTNYGDLLVLYEISEAIVHQHKVLIICSSNSEAEALFDSLPMNLNKDMNFQSTKESKSTEGQPSIEEKMKHLKNAWQYGKYIKGPRPCLPPCPMTFLNCRAAVDSEFKLILFEL
jgi:predicted ATP-dependent serine protease